MEIRDLTIFDAVAKTGSVTKAAEQLGYVQSNITARIRHLENTLGTALFHRLPRGMTLTPAGETLLSYAEQSFIFLLRRNKRYRIQNDQVAHFVSGPRKQRWLPAYLLSWPNTIERSQKWTYR